MKYTDWFHTILRTSDCGFSTKHEFWQWTGVVQHDQGEGFQPITTSPSTPQSWGGVLYLNGIIMVSRAHNMFKPGLDPINCKSSLHFFSHSFLEPINLIEYSQYWVNYKSPIQFNNLIFVFIFYISEWLVDVKECLWKQLERFLIHSMAEKQTSLPVEEWRQI